jgi:excisionase family DNA binding protein
MATNEQDDQTTAGPALETMVWLTRKELATYARVDVRTVDRWANQGLIQRYRAEGVQSVRFKRSEAEALFQKVAEPSDPFAD